MGAGSAIFGPAYSAILPGLVGREDLAGAISLNSAQMNASRVIGPVIGGVLYSLVGPGLDLRRERRHLPVRRRCAPHGHAPGGPGSGAGPRQPLARAHRRRHGGPPGSVVGRCLVTVFVFSLLALAFIGQMPVVAAHNLGINLSGLPRLRHPLRCFGRGSRGAISIGTVFSRTSKPMLVRVCLVGYRCPWRPSLWNAARCRRT